MVYVVTSLVSSVYCSFLSCLYLYEHPWNNLMVIIVHVRIYATKGAFMYSVHVQYTCILSDPFFCPVDSNSRKRPLDEGEALRYYTCS